METILLLAHTESDGALAKPALEALAAAKALGGELIVGLAPLVEIVTEPDIGSPGAAPRGFWQPPGKLSPRRAIPPTLPPRRRCAARRAPRW